MTRILATAVVSLTLALGACRDLGLPGNVPEEEARTRAPTELVEQVRAPADEVPATLVIDGRVWVPVGRPEARPEGQLRPIGSAAGQTVHARAWDERPYGAVFTRVAMAEPGDAMPPRQAMEARADRWQAYAPVIGRAGRTPSARRPATEAATEPATEPATGAPAATDQPAPATEPPQ